MRLHTGLGGGHLRDFIGVQPDLPLAAREKARGQALLQAKAHHDLNQSVFLGSRTKRQQSTQINLLERSDDAHPRQTGKRTINARQWIQV
jgi:hypothetical protein